MGVVRVVAVRIFEIGLHGTARAAVVELAEVAPGLTADAFGVVPHPAGIGHDPFAWCTASRLGGGIGLLIRPRILFVGSGGVICHVSVHTLSIVAETAEIDRCRARRQTHHGPMA